MTVKERIAALRQLMTKRGVSAVIVPGTDPHGSEYVAKHWKERNFISGFTGSAGTAVITTNKAGLWTDSRYFLQAEMQLQGSGIELFKEGLPETPSINAWLGKVLQPNDTVAINGTMISVNDYKQMSAELDFYQIKTDTSFDFISEIWTDRPELPTEKAFELDIKFAGVSAVDKIKNVRKILAEKKLDTLLLTALDEIAWLFNIRGNDIAYNPVVISYAVVSEKTAVLFVDARKVTDKLKTSLSNNGVELQSYNAVFEYLKQLSGAKMALDFGKANVSLYNIVKQHNDVRKLVSPIILMKGIKNEVELAGTRAAMVRDGVALTHFFYWLDKHLADGNLTEMSVADKLREFRSREEYFFGESFGTIAGYAEHGAIVHYEADEQSNATLKAENFLLLDSGAQYFDGTTDITRTIALGNLTDQQKTDFTLVLKGHILLGTAKFPVETRGSQLDILARKALWDNGLNYGHGTGHGVGHFLCVHEGPHNIRMNENPTTLRKGMVMSNEPGLYRSGLYGIRCENLVTVIDAEETEFGKFLCFETLTLFPFDLSAVKTDMLTNAEIEWLNTYHQRVYDKLSPFLNDEEKAWLLEKTKKIVC
jgi:Xaa-Pro aminopeptidase